MNNPLFMRGFQRLRNLFRDGQGFVERDRAARDALRKVLAFDQLHHEGTHTAGFFKAVDVRDVRMVQRGQGLSLAGKPWRAVRCHLRRDRAGL